MRKSQLRVYIFASGDRIVRNACMKGAIKISRFLKNRGALRASSRLLTEATRLFPMGARGDFGEKDLRLFGPHPAQLIAEYASYLKLQGRDHGRAPTHLPQHDVLKAHDLMLSNRIFDPFSRLALTSPAWGGVLLSALLILTVMLAAAGKGSAAGITGLTFLSVFIAAVLCRQLNGKFMAWMTMRLFYAASRKLERDESALSAPGDNKP